MCLFSCLLANLTWAHEWCVSHCIPDRKQTFVVIFLFCQTQTRLKHSAKFKTEMQNGWDNEGDVLSLFKLNSRLFTSADISVKVFCMYSNIFSFCHLTSVITNDFCLCRMSLSRLTHVHNTKIMWADTMTAHGGAGGWGQHPKQRQKRKELWYIYHHICTDVLARLVESSLSALITSQ